MQVIKSLPVALLCAAGPVRTNGQATIPAGNVGIGTSSPVHFKLEVAGNIGPDAGTGRNLGSSIIRWDTLFAHAIDANIYAAGFTPGGLIFAGAQGILLQNSNQLFWDNIHNRMGIGVTIIPEGYRLAVAGGIIAEKLKLKLQAGGWPDFVFEPSYCLPTIDSLSAFIKKHKHLPGIPSAVDMEKQGMDLAAVSTMLLQKIEELSLYIIRMHEEITRLNINGKSSPASL